MNNKNKKISDLNSTRRHPAYKKFLGIMDARVKLAIEINEARTRKEWSQQTLAKEAKTTQKVISKIESGDTNVGFDLLKKIAGPLDLRFQIGKTIFVNGIEPVASVSACPPISVGDTALVSERSPIFSVYYSHVADKVNWGLPHPASTFRYIGSDNTQLTSSPKKSDEKIKVPEFANA